MVNNNNGCLGVKKPGVTNIVENNDMDDRRGHFGIKTFKVFHLFMRQLKILINLKIC